MFLLDTNFCVVYLRGKNPHVRSRLAAHAPSEIALCSVVLAELYYGADRSANPPKNRAAVDGLIAPYVCLSFDVAASDRFARLRVHLESLGTPIGPYDLQIAAIALVHGCVVVTHNTSEFGRVPGLSIEDWELP